MFGMSQSETITAAITTGGVVLSTITIIVTVILYWLDQRRQQAARTREDLQAIIEECSRFLHPLSEATPYPILHTAAAIASEFRKELEAQGKSLKGEDVLKLQKNEDLLLSICVRGWISSTQIIRMMDIVEALESKASSHNLRGKLLIVCEASFLLAGIVAKVCSPKSFYCILKQLNLESCRKQSAEVILDEVTVELQNGVCTFFTENYKETIKECLYLIQIAADALLMLGNWNLIWLARKRESESHGHYSIKWIDSGENPMHEVELAPSLADRPELVHEVLKDLAKYIKKPAYKDLCTLIDHIGKSCIALENDRSQDCYGNHSLHDLKKAAQNLITA